MVYRNFFRGIMLMVVLGAPVVQAKTQGKLALDMTRPIVYIEFDHAGPREPIEDGEPTQGFWLRFVNNSVVPIEVELMSTATKSKLIILTDVITPIERIIPRSGVSHEVMPLGYGSSMGVVKTIAPGKDLVFSVPVNHVSPNWFMRVPFHFSLPPVPKGRQPICYAEFIWDDLPESYRSERPEIGAVPPISQFVPEIVNNPTRNTGREIGAATLLAAVFTSMMRYICL
jgi:hypothetical protein